MEALQVISCCEAASGLILATAAIWIMHCLGQHCGTAMLLAASLCLMHSALVHHWSTCGPHATSKCSCTGCCDATAACY